MNKLIAAFVIGLFSALSVFSQTMKPRVTEDLSKGMERELSTALLKGEVATVNRILADEYIEITSQGALRNKEEVMALVRVRASAPRATAVGPETSVEQTKLTIYGKIAVLMGVMKTRYQHMQYQVSTPGQPPAPDSVQRERFTRIYAKRGIRWQLVASHSTAVIAP